MSSRWWGWFPQPQQPWLKETLSKDGKLFQFTPDTSWKPSTHNQPSHLDQNGRSFNSPPRSATGSFTSNARTFLWLSPSFPSSVCRFFFSPPATSFFHKRSFSSLPSHFSHPCCLPRLHIKADDWFPNCSAGSILSCFVWRDKNNQHEYGKTCLYGNIQPSNIHISQTNLA